MLSPTTPSILKESAVNLASKSFRYISQQTHAADFSEPVIGMETARSVATLVCIALYVGQASIVSGAEILTVPPCAAEFKRGALNGSPSSCIESLQKGLRLLNSPQLVVDGLFGEATDSAVRLFQRTIGLVEDGSVGAFTRAKLNDEYGKKARPTPPPALQTGNVLSTCNVVEVSKFLNNNGGASLNPFVGLIANAPGPSEYLENLGCFTACGIKNCADGECRKSDSRFFGGACYCKRCADGTSGFIPDLISNLIPG